MATTRRGPAVWIQRCWIQAAAVQPRVAPVSATPATQVGWSRTVLEGERDVGVGAEEREGEDAAHHDGRRHAGREPQRARRHERDERAHGDRRRDEEQRDGDPEAAGR